MIATDVAVVPRLVGDAGDFGLVLRITKYKAEFPAVVAQPFELLGLAELHVGSGRNVVHIDTQTRLMLARTGRIDYLRRCRVRPVSEIRILLEPLIEQRLDRKSVV